MKMLMFDFRESERKYFETNKQTDLEIEFIKEPLTEQTVLDEKQKDETVVLSIFITSDLTEKTLSQFKNLRLITTRSTGYNHISLEYCRNNNIAVINVPNYGKSAVAQYTLGMILNLTRKVSIAASDIRKKSIYYPKYQGKNLSSITLGVIGTGSIGSAVCQLANKMGMKIYAHDIKINEDIKDYTQYVDFNTLISESDVITLHVPYIVEFYHMLSDKEFEKMKEGVYIINTSRGELIDTAALYRGITSGKVAAAALDVVECERFNFITDLNQIQPKASDNCLENIIITDKLLSMDNVIITPHIAYNTDESTMNILKSTFLAIEDYFEGGNKNRVI